MMIGARRKTWPEFSPCNSTNNKAEFNDSQHLCNSPTKTINTNTTSSLFGKKHDSTGSCPAWSLTSFMDIYPVSPSPKCSSFSPSTVISSSPTSDIFYSQKSTQYSTPRNKSQCTMSDDERKVSMSIDGIQEDLNFFVQSANWPDSKDGEDIRQDYDSSPECYTAMQLAYQPLIGMPLLVVSEEDQIVEEKSQNESTDCTGSDSPTNGHHRLITRPKPYRAFLDEIKKKELEDQINAWKEAKHLKLMTKLRRKEAAINSWELEQTKKATIHMKKIESELERKRAKASETMEKKISSIRKKADEKKAKERQLTINRISFILRVADKIGETGSRIWLKLLCCC